MKPLEPLPLHPPLCSLSIHITLQLDKSHVLFGYIASTGHSIKLCHMLPRHWWSSKHTSKTLSYAFHDTDDPMNIYDRCWILQRTLMLHKNFTIYTHKMTIQWNFSLVWSLLRFTPTTSIAIFSLLYTYTKSSWQLSLLVTMTLKSKCVIANNRKLSLYKTLLFIIIAVLKQSQISNRM